MTLSTARRPLDRLVLDVLGDLAFMVTDDGAPDLLPGTVWMHGRIHYAGPAAGTLECWCTREFATRLAANLLGLEPGDGEAQVRAPDALREFMNVLCGQTVTTWHGTEHVFDLSIPEVTECVDAPALPIGEQSDRGRLSVEGEPLLFVHTVSE